MDDCSLSSLTSPARVKSSKTSHSTLERSSAVRVEEIRANFASSLILGCIAQIIRTFIICLNFKLAGEGVGCVSRDDCSTVFPGMTSSCIIQALFLFDVRAVFIASRPVGIQLSFRLVARYLVYSAVVGW